MSCFCMYTKFLNSLIVHAVVTELSCSSNVCIPQTVQYHCETNSMNLQWQQGSVILAGISFGGMKLPKEGYNVTLVTKDGGGLSSNISFVADGNNGTTIHCVDSMAGFNSTYNCSLIIGKF